jgi:hypothetical protein
MINSQYKYLGKVFYFKKYVNRNFKNVEYGLEKIFDGAQDFLPLLGTDYVEKSI